MTVTKLPSRLRTLGWAIVLLVGAATSAAAQGDESGALMGRIQQLRTELADAERKVDDYRAAHPELVAPASSDQQISMTLVQLAAIDSDTARVGLQLEALKTLNETPMTTETVAATGDASLMMLLQARDALRAERTELAKTFRSAHPTMVELQARLKAAEQALSSAAAGALQAVTAEAEARAEQRAKLEATLVDLQKAATGSATGSVELSALERNVETARLQLDLYLAQYMAPVAPPIVEEPVVAVPPMPERPSATWLQTLIWPVGIGVVALLALALQGAIVKRLSYRKGFADGLRQAVSETQHVAEWEVDEAAEVSPGRQVA